MDTSVKITFDVNCELSSNEDEGEERRSHSSAQISRCADITSVDLDELEKSNNEENTVRQTIWAVNCFQTWLRLKSISIDFQSIEKTELNAALTQFYGSIRTTKGELYGISSYIGLRAGLNRHINEPPLSRSWNLIQDPEFTSANNVFKGIVQQIRRSGKDRTAHHPPISEEDQRILKYSAALRPDNPKSLLNKIWYDIQLHFGRRGKEGNRHLRPDSFILKRDKNGAKFFTMTTSEESKNDKDLSKRNQENLIGAMFEEPGNPLCPVASLEKYLSKIPPTAKALYLQPRKTAVVTDSIWYTAVPLGVNQLSQMLPRMCKEAGTRSSYTNHSLRATVIQKLSDAGLDARKIMAVSGRRSESSLSNYWKPSLETRKRWSNILSYQNSESDMPTKQQSRDSWLLTGCTRNGNRQIHLGDSVTEELGRETDDNGLRGLPGSEDEASRGQTDDSTLTSGHSRHVVPDIGPKGEEEELDGFPVYGADEEDWDIDVMTKTELNAHDIKSELDTQIDEQPDSLDTNDSQSRGTLPTHSDKVSSETAERREKMPEETQDTASSHSSSPHSNGNGGVQQAQTGESSCQNVLGSECMVEEAYRGEVPHSPLLKIKDEPIDEGYDSALIPQSGIGRVKEELENELKISSVFSVRGNHSESHPASQASSFSDEGQSAQSAIVTHSVQSQHQSQSLPQAQSQPPIQNLPPPLPPAPPPPPALTVRVSCSGCSKVLQKGQTAFQRKGSNQLFCSTVCLTGFSLPPPVAIAPKKTCHLCLKVISNPKDLIKVPVDFDYTLKEFCSQACLSIFRSKSLSDPPSKDLTPKCSVCKKVGEIQHEVNHQGIIHRLCSDDCFSHFRLSKRLSMSCCEVCSSCSASGNYHLLKIEDSVRKFCSPACITTFKQKSGKKAPCPYCTSFKPVEQMVEGTNSQGVTEFFCSSQCVTNSQASHSLTGASFPCTNCHIKAVPQYHLAMADGSIRNFCSYDCAVKFQEALSRVGSCAQMNGGHTAPGAPPLNDIPGSRGAPHPHRTPPHLPYNLTSLYTPAQNHALITPYVTTSNHNAALTHMSAPGVPGLANMHEQPQQQTNCPPLAQSTVRLTCKQCQQQFSSKPEVFHYKNLLGLFCSRTCCEIFKKSNNITAVCEYCRHEKVIKDIIKFEYQLRPFCCEGCKLLFKHDLTKRDGSHCRICAYCTNMTVKTIQNHFGGKLEEFCTEECMSLYTVLYYEMAKCDGCKRQGALSEALRWGGTVKHFCNLHCMLQFCVLSAPPVQPMSSGPAPPFSGLVPTAGGNPQAPLSISKDMPSIGGVVSLASTLPGQPQDPGNSAVTGTLPTSNSHSKIIGDASTQTDAMVPPAPQRRMLKNKALMCKPIIQEQSVQCDSETSRIDFHTVVDENGEKVKYVPVPVPIPMPVYIPLPMHLYTQYTPVPVGLPLPVPVPLMMSASPGPSESQPRVASQASVDAEETEKDKEKSVSHGDQGSTYSGDVESEARSTPQSWMEDTVTVQQSLGAQSEPDASSASAHSSQLHLEADFPRDKEHMMTIRLQECRRGEDSIPPRKKIRRRSAKDASRSAKPPSARSKLSHTYGLNAWVSWVRSSKQNTASQLTQRDCSVDVKEDVLECSSEELRYGLCRFVKEVRRPNGQSYTPDSVFCLCLGIQQHLFDCGRIENIFTDSFYRPFITEITQMLKDWGQSLPPSGLSQSQILEEHLWQCKQLGAYSPMVLLNTLLFFYAKLLKLRTVSQHQRLAFSRITRCCRVTKNGKISYLRIRAAGQSETKPVSERLALPAKRKMEEDEEEDMEMQENTENPLRCPVRLYEFYLSKCSDPMKQTPHLFYLQPEPSCSVDSPVWFSSQPLESDMLDSMLTRLLAVRELHSDSERPHQPVSTDDESSQ